MSNEETRYQLSRLSRLYFFLWSNPSTTPPYVHHNLPPPLPSLRCYAIDRIVRILSQHADAICNLRIISPTLYRAHREPRADGQHITLPSPQSARNPPVSDPSSPPWLEIRIAPSWSYSPDKKSPAGRVHQARSTPALRFPPWATFADSPRRINTRHFLSNRPKHPWSQLFQAKMLVRPRPSRQMPRGTMTKRPCLCGNCSC